MFELIQAGGWLMVPILGCSILALAIVIERFITLRAAVLFPKACWLRCGSWSAVAK